MIFLSDEGIILVSSVKFYALLRQQRRIIVANSRSIVPLTNTTLFL